MRFFKAEVNRGGSTGSGACIAVLPLYLWAKEITDRRTARFACLVYALMPSIVIFTATSADILKLAARMKRAVQKKFGIQLVEEVRYLEP